MILLPSVSVAFLVSGLRLTFPFPLLFTSVVLFERVWRVEYSMTAPGTTATHRQREGTEEKAMISGGIRMVGTRGTNKPLPVQPETTVPTTTSSV